jgi:large subunit ribosomal protein L17
MNRTSEHVRSMVRNTVVNLLRHERIRTTVKKAKLVRRWAEKMITLGKRGTLHARRQALAFLRSKPAVVKLFRNVAPRYAERSGGYTRIVRLAEALRPAGSDRIADFKVPAGTRLGDGTAMAILELVEPELRPRERRRRAAPEPFRPRRELYSSKAKEPEDEEREAEREETEKEAEAPEERATEERPAEEAAAEENPAEESAAGEDAGDGAE